MVLPTRVAVQLASKSVTSVVGGHCDYLPWAPKVLLSYLFQVLGTNTHRDMQIAVSIQREQAARIVFRCLQNKN